MKRQTKSPYFTRRWPLDRPVEVARGCHVLIVRFHLFSGGSRHRIATQAGRRKNKPENPKVFMRPFEIGDVVLVLPKFAHLYPGDTGVIVRVEPDPFRAMFN